MTLADLVGGDGSVTVTDKLHVRAAELEAVCRGEPFRAVYPQFWRSPLHAVIDDVNAMRRRPIEQAEAARATLLQRSGLTEDRLARRLGIDRGRLAGVSFLLWGSTFSEERDRRAGPGANQQKRGRVSRELREELEEALSDGND